MFAASGGNGLPPPFSSVLSHFLFVSSILSHLSSSPYTPPKPLRPVEQASWESYLRSWTIPHVLLVLLQHSYESLVLRIEFCETMCVIICAHECTTLLQYCCENNTQMFCKLKHYDSRTTNAEDLDLSYGARLLTGNIKKVQQEKWGGWGWSPHMEYIVR